MRHIEFKENDPVTQVTTCEIELSENQGSRGREKTISNKRLEPEKTFVWEFIVNKRMSTRPFDMVIHYPCFQNVIRIGKFYIAAAGNVIQVRGESSNEWKKSDAINESIIALKPVGSGRILCASDSHDLNILCLKPEGQLEKE